MRYRVQRVVDWSVNHVEQIQHNSFGNHAGPLRGGLPGASASAAAMLPLSPVASGGENAANGGIVQVNQKIIEEKSGTTSEQK